MDCVWVADDKAKEAAFTLAWNNGAYVDSMLLSQDSSTLEEKNQHNGAIKDKRK